MTVAPSPAKPVATRLASIVRQAPPSRSTKTHRPAPREMASIPAAPLPAKRSSTVAPGRSGSTIANSVCFTRSPSGRVPSPGVASRRPRAEPAITRPASATPRRPDWFESQQFGQLEERVGDEGPGRELVHRRLDAGPWAAPEEYRSHACPGRGNDVAGDS